MIKRLKYTFLAALFALYLASPALAVLPNIFATQPAGNVAASLLDTNFTFLEAQGVQALTTTGTPNAYVATPADAWVTGYSSYVGRSLTVIPNFTNTDAATISVSGLGTASLYKNLSGTATALASGDIKANIPVVLICDGTGFLLVNPSVSANTTPIYHIQAFTSTGANTFTTPANTLSTTVFKFTLTGGGGGGGGDVGQSYQAGGGGAGSTAINYVSGLAASTGYTITIGAGGAAGTSGNGSAGGNSSFVIGATTTTAPGGGAGIYGQNVNGGAGGGACTNATISIPGGGGGSPASQGGAAFGGFGGSSYWGGGGQSAGASGSTSGAGIAGQAPGSGGSGGSNSNVGGAGANGIDVVEYVL